MPAPLFYVCQWRHQHRIEVVGSTLSERYQQAASALPALMPRWTPARHEGQAVACLATMEVLF